MSTPRKWAEVIHAWADGKVVQWRVEGNAWLNADIPSFDPDIEWRIKPDALRYRVALICDEEGRYWTRTADNDHEASDQPQRSGFVKWLTDWTEYEA